MNIIADRQARRAKQIAKIKEALIKIYESETPSIDYKRFLLGTMSGMNLSKRTARDYIEIALFDLELQINKKEGLLLKNDL